MTEINTIIIGGGLSGLYTAVRLRALNIPFLLLEAKSSLGGRISSKPTLDDASLAVDLGPTWFWPHQTKMLALINELGLDYFEQYTAGDVLYQLSAEQSPTRHRGAGALLSYRIKGGMQNIINALASTLSKGSLSTDSLHTDGLNTDSLHTDSIKMSHPVNGVEYRNKQWLISVENSGQSQLLSQAQSTGTNLGNNLGANFDKNAAIDDQKKQQNAGNEHLFCAKNLIMAVPPRQILNYLTPTQYLSPELIAALSSTQTWMSAQAKFVAVYQTAFWREQGLAGQVFSKTGPMVEIHDASASPMQGFALFGFIGVPLAMRKKIATEHLNTACIEQLVALFGPVARTPKVSYLTDWATDKYVATEQDLTELPRHAEFSMQRHQHELNSLNLYLSASEVSANEAGYLEGALGAADEVIKQLVRPEN